MQIASIPLDLSSAHYVRDLVYSAARRISLIVFALMSFVVYAHAIRKLFSREHGIDWRMRALQICGTVFAVLHLWWLWSFAQIGVVQYVAAIALYASGISVFVAAKNALNGYRLTLAFSPDVPRQLIDEGVYARVRHPFYLAYSLTWAAGGVAAPSTATIGSSLIMIVFYIVAARIEERKFLATDLGITYALYRSSTGMMWPRI